MSHFTSIKTRIIEKENLKRALQDLGRRFEEGKIEIRGWQGNRTLVEIKVPTSNPEYDLGFRKNGEVYELVADWFGIRDINQKEFVNLLNQRYAYHAAREKLEEQGFSVASEEKQKDGQIHLVLRRAK